MDNQDQTVKQVVLDVTQFPTLETLEREYITLALAKTNGNKVEAAKILGVSIKTIYNKLANYNPPSPTVQS